MKNVTVTILSFLLTNSFAQSNDESWKLYSDNTVARIDITIDPVSLEWIYNNVQSDSEHFASMHFTNSFINESVDSIGFRLKGNTSRDSQKKSFKISFNTFVDGREFYDVDKLNLNGEHNDPSIIRSKLCFDLYKDISMTASRAIHSEVYINGQYFGLYISVEHIDDEFLDKNFDDASGNLWKCLYPADLVYLGDDPSDYQIDSDGRPVYELTTNEDVNDYSQLARLIKIINYTPNNLLPDSLEKILTVPEVLKYLAMNTLTGSWDDYRSLMNNYYLYYNPSEDKFHWIPYDYDNSYGIDWAGIDWANASPYNYPTVISGPRPLSTRLMSNSQYRNLYTHFLQFYKENVFKLNLWENRIDSIKNLITPYAEDDFFRTLDYDFTMNDFIQSYNASPYSNQHVKKGVKQFVNERYNSLSTQLNYLPSIPTVYDIKWTPEIPLADDTIYVTAAAFSHAGLSEVSVRYTPTGSGTEEIYPMDFQPITPTKIVEDSDRWVGIIPPLGEGNSGSFKIFVKDVNLNSVKYPRHKSIYLGTPVTLNNLVINEFCADNDNIIQDEAGEYDDWLEIYNPTSEDIDLSGMYLSDRSDSLIKWQFPDGENIRAGEFILIWCDEDQEQGNFHTNFALSAGGEFLVLTASDGITVIDSISFGSQATDASYGRFPDAGDNWQFYSQPTPGYSNTVTSVNESPPPLSYDLTAYPNPFNPTTNIEFRIANIGFISLKVYDVLGNELATLINEEKPAGIYKVEFNGSNLSSGVYFFRLEVGSFVSTKKLLLLK